MLVLVDANVLLRLIEPEHAQHTAAVSASESLDALGHAKIVVPQVVYELRAVATRPKEVNGLGMANREVQSKLEGLFATFRLLRDERKIYERWRELIADHDVKGKQVHDARIVAAMLRHGISHLLTFNASDFTRYLGITFVDPQKAGELERAE